MPRSDSPEWFWDTSMAIGRSAEDEFFFFATNFLESLPHFFRNLGTCSETKKKHTQKKNAFFFSGFGEEKLNTPRNSSITFDFGDTTIGMDFFLVDIFAKITTIIPTIWDH